MRYRYYGYPPGVPYDAARRKLQQATRAASCRVVGSRWNRPCPLADVCSPGTPCICDLPRIVTMRSRCCNRVACSFLKWCYAEPDQDWRPIAYRWYMALAFADIRLKRWLLGVEAGRLDTN